MSEPCAPDPEDAPAERMGWLGPDELRPYVGRHVAGYCLPTGTAGHLREVTDDGMAVVVNGFGVNHVPVRGRWWCAWSTPFLLGGRPVA